MKESEKRRAKRTGKPIPPSVFTVAWNKYKESDNYKKTSDGNTLGISPLNQVYLENRIANAYREGWMDRDNAGLI